MTVCICTYIAILLRSGTGVCTWIYYPSNISIISHADFDLHLQYSWLTKYSKQAIRKYIRAPVPRSLWKSWFLNWWHGRLEYPSILLLVRDYKIDTQFYEMKLGRPTMVFMRKGRRSSDIGKRWLPGFLRIVKTQCSPNMKWFETVCVRLDDRW